MTGWFSPFIFYLARCTENELRRQEILHRLIASQGKWLLLEWAFQSSRPMDTSNIWRRALIS